MYALYVQETRLTFRYTSVHVSVYARRICMPYMYALHVCLMCMPSMYAYTYALYVCLIRTRNTVSFSVDGKDLGIAYTSVPESDLFPVVNIPLKGKKRPANEKKRPGNEKKRPINEKKRPTIAAKRFVCRCQRPS